LTNYISMSDARTPVTISDVAAAIPEAYRAQYGFYPSRQGAALALGHMALETGRFKSIYGFNVGNVVCTGGATCWRPSWFEITEASSTRDKTLHVEMKAGRAPSAFAVLPDLVSGLGSYFRVVGKRKGMSEALHAGDALRYAQETVSSNYCGNCDANSLGQSLASLQREFMPHFDSLDSKPMPAESNSMGAWVVGGMLTLATLGFVAMRRR
jgi:hypothetical protein